MTSVSRRDGSEDGGDRLPMWLLDVDGVINSIGRPATGTAHRSVDLVVQEWPVVVWYQPDIVDRINALHRAGRAHVAWLTTWDHEAADVLAPAIGLDDFPIVTEPPGTYAKHPGSRLGHTWWKLAAAHAELARAPRPALIWTDDEISDDVRAATKARWPELPTLMLRPLEMPGLTPEHLDRIEDFLSSIRPGTASEAQ